MSGLVASRQHERASAPRPATADGGFGPSGPRGCGCWPSVIALLVIAWDIARKAGSMEDFGLDAHAYWAVNVADPYRLPAGTPDAFLYSPPFVYVFGVLQTLPWPVFHALWLGVALVALVWLAGRMDPSDVGASTGLQRGVLRQHQSPHRSPLSYSACADLPSWAFVLLSKVTPGIGVAWFAARGDWRKLAIAVGVTAAIVAGSFALTPHLWFEWVDTLPRLDPDFRHCLPRSRSRSCRGSGWPSSLLIWAGRTGRLWVLPIAVTLAIPVLWSASLSILVALVPLVRPVSERRLRQARSARIMSRAPALSTP